MTKEELLEKLGHVCICLMAMDNDLDEMERLVRKLSTERETAWHFFNRLTIYFQKACEGKALDEKVI
jgi:hypothetical protein